MDVIPQWVKLWADSGAESTEWMIIDGWDKNGKEKKMIIVKKRKGILFILFNPLFTVSTTLPSH